MVKTPFFRSISTIRTWFNDLQLQHKIGWSFGLAMSVALVGITTGLGVAESSLSRAQADIEDSEAEREMLSELKISVLRLHLHQKGTILTLNDVSQWTEVYTTFTSDRKAFDAAWHTYKDNHEAVTGDTIHDQKERQLISDLVTSYTVFSKDLDSLVGKFHEADLETLTEAERRTLQAQLTEFNNEALRQEAYRILDRVKALNDISKIQLKEAKVAFERAEVFTALKEFVRLWCHYVISLVLMKLISNV